MILGTRTNYKPIQYEWAYNLFEKHEKMHWLPTEVPMADDIRDYNTRLTSGEKNLLIQILRFFTQGDLEVQNNYNTQLIHNFQLPEITMMLSSFASRENIHVWAYSHLNDTLGLAENEYSKFLEYEEMRKKIDKMHYYSSGASVSDMALALNLAVFGGFIEGVSLFGSFAVLLNFSRRGLMKGVGQIVAWSAEDENCFDDKTEVLTENGWKLFRDVVFGEKVAQMNLTTKDISFERPLKYIEKDFKGELVYLKDGVSRLDVACTKDHDLLYNYKYNPSDNLKGYKFENYQKVKASDINTINKSTRYKYPLAGCGIGEDDSLTPLERLRIAIQADGSLDLRPKDLGARTGGTSVNFTLKKKRKKQRLEMLLSQAGIEYTSSNLKREGYTQYHFVLPIISRDKSLSWIKLDTLSVSKSRAIIEEITHWDGHDKYKDGSFIEYVTTCEVSRDKIQAVSILAGFFCNVQERPDNRSATYNTSYKLAINTKVNEGTWHCVEQKERHYEGKVYCFTMPEGSLVVRRGLKHVIVGNCHSLGVSTLFKTLVQESNINLEVLADRVYTACIDIVNAEKEFLKLCFADGDVVGLKLEDSYKYIEYLADMRLRGLGYEPIFKVSSNPLPYMDTMLSAKEHTNFFENRATEYAKGAIKW